MPLSILDEDNLLVDDIEAVSPTTNPKSAAGSRKYHNNSNTAKANTASRKINVVPQSIGVLRTVANKLPDSHLSKVPLDKLLSYNTGIGHSKKEVGRNSELHITSKKSHNGPSGSLFDA
jgi:hypothetical protein